MMKFIQDWVYRYHKNEKNSALILHYESSKTSKNSSTCDYFQFLCEKQKKTWKPHVFSKNLKINEFSFVFHDSWCFLNVTLWLIFWYVLKLILFKTDYILLNNTINSWIYCTISSFLKTNIYKNNLDLKEMKRKQFQMNFDVLLFKNIFGLITLDKFETVAPKPAKLYFFNK